MNKKIIVIGSPGSGKSYFSKKLAKLLNIPVYHMDNIYWREDKTHISREELVHSIDDIMNKEQWIIDGNYFSTMEQRLKGAETIVYLDFDTEQCVEGIKSRIRIKRDDMPWIEEEVDEEFLDFVTGFREKIGPQITNLLEQYKDKEIIRFSSREEEERLLSEYF
ncbi:Adenylate kinase [Hathewaya proteolytica DSM 3090]|uniref:Adenylate kinase n=1 Tax=Hathewaya proteolytica DSM 3090 TaxID=1121331 RepID=A0A1M6RJ23_9CLOT|nr:hypothetical protein [Hathewaya proteolytica]SHK32357.1 Adenylate kinase [Hathewaya proteolytica DSM 3090]